MNYQTLLPTLALLLALLYPASMLAQDTHYQLTSDHEVILDGTSNARDWSADVQEITGSLVLGNSAESGWGDLSPGDVKMLELAMPVAGLDSGNRGLTRNLQGYLKRDEHPVITFRLDRITAVEPTGDTTALLRAEGTVTAAGQSSTVDMEVNAERDGSGGLLFSGRQQLKMTDFGITPPTALLGTIRAVDEMTLIYSVRFTRE